MVPTASATLQLNLHGPGFTPAEVARLPVQPGNSDLCFEWKGPIADAVAHLGRCKVAIHRGPIERFGAKGPGTSVYFRDPDGSLLEFISYDRGADIHDDHSRSDRAADRPPGAAGRRRRAPSRGPQASRRCRLPATDGAQVDLSNARRPHGRLHLSAHRRAGAAVARRLGRDPGRARLHAAVLLVPRPFRRAQAARRRAALSACRRRTATISARRSSGCICRFRSCPMPHLRSRRRSSCRPSRSPA